MSEDVRSAATRLLEKARVSAMGDSDAPLVIEMTLLEDLLTLVADLSHQITRQQQELAALGDPPCAWQPMETAPKDGTQFLVYWQGSPMGGKPSYYCIAWDEYQEIQSYGEPPALGWMPLPAAPVPDAK